MSGTMVVLTNYLLKVVELKPWGEIKVEDKRACGSPVFSSP